MKIFLIILGAFLVLLGAACTAGGTAAVVIPGRDGWIQSGTDSVDVRGTALVSGTEEFESERGGDDFPGHPRIRVRAESDDGSPIFIGVARAGAATNYLQGVPHDVIDDVDFDPTRFRTDFVPGTGSLEPPEEQDFWLDSVSGAGRQELDWEIESGEFRVVVTPVEPREGFVVDVSAGVKVPWLRRAGIALIIGGLLVLIAGVVLIVLTARRVGRDPRVVPPTQPAGGAPPAVSPPPASELGDASVPPAVDVQPPPPPVVDEQPPPPPPDRPPPPPDSQP